MNAQRKSTTHEEMYFQIKEPHQHGGREFSRGTVFFRNLGDPTAPMWYGSVARCSANDQFCKKVGRSVARRHFFSGVVANEEPILERPTYEIAKQLYKGE